MRSPFESLHSTCIFSDFMISLPQSLLSVEAADEAADVRGTQVAADYAVFVDDYVRHDRSAVIRVVRYFIRVPLYLAAAVFR